MIPESVTTIGNSAFSHCRRLTDAYFYGDVPTSWGSDVFGNTASDFTIHYLEGKSGWTTPTWKAPDESVYNTDTKPFTPTLQDGNFTYTVNSDGTATITGTTKKTGELNIPSTVGGHKVTAIEERAFHNCDKLTGNLVIPESVTSIGDFAFSSCSGLTGNLVIPESVTTIGDYAFFSCSGLTGNLVIPESVTTIGHYAFGFCSGLNGNLVISESVTSIGSAAFYYCNSLTGNLVIPESVTTIGDSAFYFCSGLTGNLVIPESVTTIGDSAFYFCSGLTGNLVIPESVTVIGNRAFYNCSGFSGSLVIPEGVTTLGTYAFSYCDGLTSVEIPSIVTTIGDGAFRGCQKLISIDVAEENPNYRDIDGILFSKDGTQLLQYPAGKTGAYAIPSGVTVIGNDAFGNCSNLTGIEIPSSMMTIGNDAFWNCYRLTSVEIPSSVTAIGGRTFAVCYGLTNIDVAEGNLNYCDKDGVLFSKNGTQLLQYPAGKTGTYAIPSGVTSIGDYAFLGCTGLTGDLVIPDSVTSIGDSAFYNCRGLTGDLVIGDSVTTIGNDAFNGCNSLTDAYFYGDVPASWGSSAFANNASNFTIHYFEGKAGWTTPTWKAPDKKVYNTKPIDLTSLNDTVVGTGFFNESIEGRTFLCGIPAGTTVSALSESFVTDALSMKDTDGNVLSADAVLKTGDRIYLMSADGKTVLDEATIIVTGDVNCDGESNVLDLLRGHQLTESSFMAYWEMLACDLNGNHVPDVNDLISMIKEIAS